MADETKRLDGKTQRISTAETKRLAGEDYSAQMAFSGIGLPANTLIAGRYRVIREVGQGGESDAFLCEDTKDAQAQVVVKIYRGNFEPDREVLNKLTNLDNKDILKLLGYGTFSERFFEVSEYAAGGTMADAIKQGVAFNEKSLTQIAIPQVVNAFKHCHSRGIIHRDIKPENLFYRDKNKTDIIVGDFGLSSALVTGSSLRLSSRKGFTFSYSAPELFSGATPDAEKQIFGIEVDYYALGVTLIALLLGRDPFENMPFAEIAFKKQQGEVPIPDFCSDRFKSLLRGLLHPQRKKRWGREQIRRWYKGENVEVAEYEKNAPSFYYKLADDLIAHNIQELARLFLDHPDRAKEHIGEGIVTRTLERYNQDLGLRISKIIKQASSTDNALIEIIYTLDSVLPYRLLPGVEANSPDALAILIDKNKTTWDAGREQLYNNNISTWLRVIGRRTILEEWNRIANHHESDKDLGLESFLHILNPKMRWPSIALNTTEIVNIGNIEGGVRGSLSIIISNPGRGYLYGNVKFKNPIAGASLSQTSFRGRQTTVTLILDTNPLDRGKAYKTSLQITSNAGPPISIPIFFNVTFPFSAVTTDLALFGVAGAVLSFSLRLLIGVTGERNPHEWLSTYFGAWGSNVPPFSGSQYSKGAEFGILVIVILIIVIGITFFKRRFRRNLPRH